MNENNRLAWQLYWDTRLPTKDILLQLEVNELTEAEAGDVAMKIRALSIRVNELEVEKAKNEAAKAGRK